MKSKMLSMFVLVSLLWGIISVSPSSLNAASENTIRLYNIGGQAVFTLLKGILQGKVKNFKDGVKTFFYGSVTGYGFYEAKKMIGKGHVTAGIILANLCASITENVASGYHPLAYLGYTIGPARIEVATPIARDPVAIFNVSVTPGDLLTFYYQWKQADRILFRNGMITFIADEPIYANALGWTRGIYPTVLDGQPDYVYNHEVIHVAQHLQMMTISPEWSMSSKMRSNNKKPGLIQFNGLRWNVLGMGMDLLTYELQSYRDNIFEVEAYHFATE